MRVNMLMQMKTVVWKYDEKLGMFDSNERENKEEFIKRIGRRVERKKHDLILFGGTK